MTPVHAVVAVLVVVSPGAAQVVDDPAVEELRQRAPAGANDQRTIDQWLTGLVTRLAGASDHEAAGRTFLDTLRRVRDDAGTKQAFRDVLAARLSAIAQSKLVDGSSLPVHAARAIVQALRAANDPGTVPGLTAALTFSDQPTRYFAAAGLQSLRDRIATDVSTMSTVIAAIRDAGTAERNAVVVERLYRALSFADAPGAAVDAVTAILASRVERYRKGAPLADSAELAAFDYLAQATLTQAQKAAVIPLLAVLLRLDVARYAGGDLLPAERDAIDLRINACESLIEHLCGCTGGNVRGESQSGGPGARIRMQLELDKWVGVPQQSQGVLNGPPWNVPPGAP